MIITNTIKHEFIAYHLFLFQLLQQLSHQQLFCYNILKSCDNFAIIKHFSSEYVSNAINIIVVISCIAVSLSRIFVRTVSHLVSIFLHDLHVPLNCLLFQAATVFSSIFFCIASNAFSSLASSSLLHPIFLYLAFNFSCIISMVSYLPLPSAYFTSLQGWPQILLKDFPWHGSWHHHQIFVPSNQFHPFEYECLLVPGSSVMLFSCIFSNCSLKAKSNEADPGAYVSTRCYHVR